MSCSTSNFYFGDLIGEGMFGKVHLAKVKESKDNDPHEENNPNFLRKCKVPTYLAIKTMDKIDTNRLMIYTVIGQLE